MLHDFHIAYGAGTGKSVTGAHIAYALVMKLRLERAKETKFSECEESESTRSCVMYCGPSQQSVNVVLGKLLQLIHYTDF